MLELHIAWCRKFKPLAYVLRLLRLIVDRGGCVRRAQDFHLLECFAGVVTRGSLDCQAQIKRKRLRARLERNLGQTARAAACFKNDLSFHACGPASRTVETVPR